MILTILLLLFLLQSPDQTCTWEPAREVGALDTRMNESSGMAISRRIANRTYRINDSGDTGRFFVLDFAGAVTKIVQIAGFNPADTEDMSIGPCGDSGRGDCIFIGDIGDNARRRQTVRAHRDRRARRLPFRSSGGTPRSPAISRRATRRRRSCSPSGRHRVHHHKGHDEVADLQAETEPVAQSSKSIEVLELVVTLDWSQLRPNTLGFTRMVTGMSIAPDGKRFLLLNYGDAMEFFVDLSAETPDPGRWKQGVDYRTIALTTLEQEETISYLPDGRSLLYDTEKSPNAREARIMRMDCR